MEQKYSFRRVLESGSDFLVDSYSDYSELERMVKATKETEGYQTEYKIASEGASKIS